MHIIRCNVETLSVPADCRRGILVLLLRSKTGDASLRHMYQDITLFLVLFKLHQSVLSDNWQLSG